MDMPQKGPAMPAVEKEESPEMLVSDIGAKLGKLADALPPEQRAKIEKMMAELGNLGGEEESEVEAESAGLVSAQGGKSGVPVGPQDRY